MQEALQEIQNTVLSQVSEALARQLFGQMRDTFTTMMTGWDVEAKAIDQYPFLKDKGKFIEDFFSCLSLDIVDQRGQKEIQLNVNMDRMQSFGYPDQMFWAMEYGNSVFPVMGFLRSSLQDIEMSFSDMLKGM